MGDQPCVDPQPINLEPTAILDSIHPQVLRLAEMFPKNNIPDRIWLRTLHSHLVKTLRPVYSLNAWQPASRTLQNGRGSCSQRMACLEAVARAAGIAKGCKLFG